MMKQQHLQTILISLGTSIFVMLGYHFLLGPSTLLSSRSSSGPGGPVPGRMGMATPAAGVQISITCASDAPKFCSGLSDLLLDACLQDSFEKVSAECRADLQKTRDSFAVCEKDIAKFCNPPKYGGGRMVKCLKEHAAKLSAACASRVGGR